MHNAVSPRLVPCYKYAGICMKRKESFFCSHAAMTMSVRHCYSPYSTRHCYNTYILTIVAGTSRAMTGMVIYRICSIRSCPARMYLQHLFHNLVGIHKAKSHMSRLPPVLTFLSLDALLRCLSFGTENYLPTFTGFWIATRFDCPIG